MRLLETFKNQTVNHVPPGLPSGRLMAASTSDPARDEIGQKTMMTSQLSRCVSSTRGDGHLLSFMICMMSESAPHVSPVKTRPTFTVEGRILPAVKLFRLNAEEDKYLLLFLVVKFVQKTKRLVDSKTHCCCLSAQISVTYGYCVVSLFPVLDGRWPDGSPHPSSPFSSESDFKTKS